MNVWMLRANSGRERALFGRNRLGPSLRFGPPPGGGTGEQGGSMIIPFSSFGQARPVFPPASQQHALSIISHHINELSSLHPLYLCQLLTQRREEYSDDHFPADARARRAVSRASGIPIKLTNQSHTRPGLILQPTSYRHSTNGHLRRITRRPGFALLPLRLPNLHSGCEEYRSRC